MRLSFRLLVALAALALAGPAAFATPVSITPGHTVTAFTPTTASFTGVEIGSYSMTFSNAFENGTVYEDVYDNSGSLDFYYQVTDNASSQDSLSRITVGNYKGFTTAVDYLLNGGDAPTSATRQSSGTSVGFNFDVEPGTTSDWLEVATDAKVFGTGSIGLLDSVATNFPNALGPQKSVPEPSSLALIGLGLLAVAGAARRKLFVG